MSKMVTMLVLVLFTGLPEMQAFSAEYQMGPDSLHSKNKPQFRYPKTKDRPQQVISLNGGQLFRREIQLGYERSFGKKFALETVIGYRIPSKNLQFYAHKTSIGAIYDYAERMPFSRSLLTRATFKFCQCNTTGFYQGISLFYRYRYYNRKSVSDWVSPYASENWSSIQSLDLNILGANFLVGKTGELARISDRVKIIYDLYAGLGFKVKKAETTFYSKQSGNFGYHPPGFPAPVPPPYTPNTVKEKSTIPYSPSLGLKIGCSF